LNSSIAAIDKISRADAPYIVQKSALESNNASRAVTVVGDAED
jgi:hypothetical protein